MQGSWNESSDIRDDDKLTKFRITRSNLKLRKKLDNIDYERSKSMSKINQCVEEARHTLRLMRIQNETASSQPRPPSNVRPMRHEKRVMEKRIAPITRQITKKIAKPKALKYKDSTSCDEQPHLGDRDESDGLAEDAKRKSDSETGLVESCQSPFESSDETDIRKQDVEFEVKEEEKLEDGSAEKQICSSDGIEGAREENEDYEGTSANDFVSRNSLVSEVADDNEETRKSGFVINDPTSPKAHQLAQSSFELGTGVTNIGKSSKLRRRASTPNLLFPTLSMAVNAAANTDTAQRNPVRRLSDHTNCAQRPSCGDHAAISKNHPRPIARRSSIAIMTTNKDTLPDLTRRPLDPSTSSLNISPRYKLSLDRLDNGRGAETRKQAAVKETLHESLLKIGRRMIAPMTGVELQEKLRGRRHSLQYPLVASAVITATVKISTSESDLYNELGNCRYLRGRPSKHDDEAKPN